MPEQAQAGVVAEPKPCNGSLTSQLPAAADVYGLPSETGLAPRAIRLEGEPSTRTGLCDVGSAEDLKG